MHALRSDQNDLQLCTTHKGYVLNGKEGSVGLILGQLGSRRSKLGSTGVMLGQEDQTKISWEDLSGRLGDGFYESNVIWFGKQLCERGLVIDKLRG